ncbi:MAG: sulfotransferase [Nitrospinota bacterium]
MTFNRLASEISEKCNEAILISGSARSGTTILSKILHSFKNVELAYEPPVLFSLFALLPELEEKQWRLLYETFLYEEFFINALSGRSINCNRKDDSSVYRVKNESEIEKRLNQYIRKPDSEILGQSSWIAYKIPDVVKYLPKLKKLYPKTKLIIMTRDPVETFHSLREKAWFSDASLKNKNEIWPNRIIKGFRIPFWVDQKDERAWVEMDELHRIAYYYHQVSHELKELQDYIQINYDDLVNDPYKTITGLAEKLGLSFGEKTEEILKTVSRTKKDRDPDILKKLSPEIQSQVQHYAELSTMTT